MIHAKRNDSELITNALTLETGVVWGSGTWADFKSCINMDSDDVVRCVTQVCVAK
jgi:hypothetical protein